jgi:hypothetical protein
MKLTEAQRRLLTRLRDARLGEAERDPYEYPEDEVVCSGIHCYLGTDHVSYRTVQSLLRLVALSDHGEAGGLRRFHINETGEHLLADESQIDVLVRALAEGGSWTWKAGKLVPI